MTTEELTRVFEAVSLINGEWGVEELALHVYQGSYQHCSSERKIYFRGKFRLWSRDPIGFLFHLDSINKEHYLEAILVELEFADGGRTKKGTSNADHG